MYYMYNQQMPVYRMIGWGDVVERGSYMSPRLVADRVVAWSRALWELVRGLRTMDDVRVKRKTDDAKTRSKKAARLQLIRVCRRAGMFAEEAWPLLPKAKGAKAFCGKVVDIAGFDCLEVSICVILFSLYHIVGDRNFIMGIYFVYCLQVDLMISDGGPTCKRCFMQHGSVDIGSTPYPVIVKVAPLDGMKAGQPYTTARFAVFEAAWKDRMQGKIVRGKVSGHVLTVLTTSH